MKRSEINKQINWAIALCARQGFNLPSFAFWKPEYWKENQDNLQHMTKSYLGWDVTDYGGDDFDKMGAVLFTLRNGNIYDSSIGTPYCEKLIAMKDEQVLPMHFHYSKTEDIINRSGSTLRVTVFNSLPESKGYALDTKSRVKLRVDGEELELEAGSFVDVKPGDSITLFPYIYHMFQAVGGDLLVGEVSSINDDAKDNHFIREMDLSIEEDAKEDFILCGGYVQK